MAAHPVEPPQSQAVHDGLIPKAVMPALNAGDWQRAADLVERRGWQLLDHAKVMALVGCSAGGTGCAGRGRPHRARNGLRHDGRGRHERSGRAADGPVRCSPSRHSDALELLEVLCAAARADRWVP
jgi:hypothetical protein